MLEQFFNETIPQAIIDKSTVTLAIIFTGGLLTSISPCVLSMIPVLMSYIGVYGEGRKRKGLSLSISFVAGLAATFAILGFIASYFGLIFGQIGSVWYYILAAVALVMGLHLVGSLQLNFPSLKRLAVKPKGHSGAFLMGLFFGLVASPCATPVLAVIIAFAATQGQPAYGALLLFVYGIGHGFPLLLAGTFTTLLAALLRLQRYTQYVNYASGSILIIFGLYLLIWISW